MTEHKPCSSFVEVNPLRSFFVVAAGATRHAVQTRVQSSVLLGNQVIKTAVAVRAERQWREAVEAVFTPRVEYPRDVFRAQSPGSWLRSFVESVRADRVAGAIHPLVRVARQGVSSSIAPCFWRCSTVSSICLCQWLRADRRRRELCTARSTRGRTCRPGRV